MVVFQFLGFRFLFGVSYGGYGLCQASFGVASLAAKWQTPARANTHTHTTSVFSLSGMFWVLHVTLPSQSLETRRRLLDRTAFTRKRLQPGAPIAQPTRKLSQCSWDLLEA